MSTDETTTGTTPSEDAIRLAEAFLFAAAEPVATRALQQILPEGEDAEAVLEALAARYAGRGIELSLVAGGAQFRTAADLAPRLRRVLKQPRRLPRAAMETLAIVAYHQPLTRSEIEALRGVGLSQETFDLLLQAGFVAPAGKKEAPGRPTLWVTTPHFLASFGLAALSELPRREDLLTTPAP